MGLFARQFPNKGTDSTAGGLRNYSTHSHGCFGMHVPTKLSFIFYKERLLFEAPNLTVGLSDICVFAVHARDRISGVRPLIPRFLANFNIVFGQVLFMGSVIPRMYGATAKTSSPYLVHPCKYNAKVMTKNG